MTTRTYILAVSSIIMGIVVIPDWELMLKVYVISVVAFITVIINLLFRIQKIREWIVNQITADVIRQVLTDEDIRKLLRRIENPASRRDSPFRGRLRRKRSVERQKKGSG